MSKRKYRPTSRICSLSDFENSKATWFEVRYGSQYRMWHRSALESLQVHTLICFIKSGGGIYACEKIENESSEVSCLLQHNRFHLALAERREYQMILLEDTRNQVGKHDKKNEYFSKNGIEVRRTKLYCGDYTLPTDQSVCIDTKKDIQELIGDICGKSHERFRNELIRAQESNIKLIILTEDDGCYCDRKKTIYNKPVTCINDLFSWKNPRLFIWQGGKQKYPKATKGQTLAKCLITLQEKYGCEFAFTTKKNSGSEILRILGITETV